MITSNTSWQPAGPADAKINEGCFVKDDSKFQEISADELGSVYRLPTTLTLASSMINLVTVMQLPYVSIVPGCCI